MLHVVKGESIAGVDVSKKFLISFLVARCGREEKAHQDDEGKDVAHAKFCVLDLRSFQNQCWRTASEALL